MNPYITALLVVIGFIVGFVIGLINRLGDIDGNKPSKKLSKSKIQSHRGIPKGDTKEKHSKLNEKFTDNEDSFVDMLCDITNEDESQYVENSRKKQNYSYNYTGRK